MGWTKLQIIGQRVTKDNVEKLVGLAEQLKTKQLERKMQGQEPREKPPSRVHCVLMYFSPKQYAELKKPSSRTAPSDLGAELSVKKRHWSTPCVRRYRDWRRSADHREAGSGALRRPRVGRVGKEKSNFYAVNCIE
jgi:hypothetical protein